MAARVVSELYFYCIKYGVIQGFPALRKQGVTNTRVFTRVGYRQSADGNHRLQRFYFRFHFLQRNAA